MSRKHTSEKKKAHKITSSPSTSYFDSSSPHKMSDWIPPILPRATRPKDTKCTSSKMVVRKGKAKEDKLGKRVFDNWIQWSKGTGRKASADGKQEKQKQTAEVYRVTRNRAIKGQRNCYPRSAPQTRGVQERAALMEAHRIARFASSFPNVGLDGKITIAHRSGHRFRNVLPALESKPPSSRM